MNVFIRNDDQYSKQCNNPLNRKISPIGESKTVVNKQKKTVVKRVSGENYKRMCVLNFMKN